MNTVNKPTYDGNGRLIGLDYVDSEVSQRDSKGKLILKPNPFALYKIHETFMKKTGTSPLPFDINAWGYGGQQYYTERQDAAIQARARMVGRLHKGGASLGVTIASASQARQMIKQRLVETVNIFSRIKSPERGREAVRDMKQFAGMPLSKVAKATADSHLEWIFGWLPLYQDIHSAMHVLVSDFPDQFLRATGRVLTDNSFFMEPGVSSKHELLTHKVVYQCRVRVENPNVWLLNRLGLINPAVIAWDLVPWSFVVNLFVNVNQVLRSFTDLAGLELTDRNVTLTTRGVRTMTYHACPWWTGSSTSTQTFKMVERYLGPPPMPSLTARMPDLSLDLVFMTAALAVQQVTRIAKLLR